jgi:hypothetical protein
MMDDTDVVPKETVDYHRKVRRTADEHAHVQKLGYISDKHHNMFQVMLVVVPSSSFPIIQC